MLQEYVDQLPDNEHVPMAPFSSMVVNLKVSTSIHRDWKDWTNCAVLVVSDCEAGELVFFELGIVVRACHCNYMLFPSWQISHFNKHFKGKCASFVFHTDKSGKDGIEKNFNGWGDSIKFIKA